MSFGIYIVGYVILIAGLAIGAHFLNVPPGSGSAWAFSCLIGIRIIHGVTATRHRTCGLTLVLTYRSCAERECLRCGRECRRRRAAHTTTQITTTALRILLIFESIRM